VNPRLPRAVQRVMMTADAIGGVWTFACDLARALGEQDVRVSLAVLGPAPSAEQRAAIERLPHVDLFEHPGRLEWMADPWPDVADAGEWLLQLARRVGPDVIHLSGLCHGALPWPAPVMVTGHSCVLSWWRSVHGTEAPSAWSRYAQEVSRSLRATALVAAPTAAMLASLDADYGPLPRARVIRNGRDVRFFGNIVAAKEPFVLAAGRLWDEAKNVQTVCAAARRISWPLYVAGETQSPDGVTFECDGVGLIGRLEPDGMAGWMSRAAIYTLPARYEPFGLSVLEAALAGCALVLGDIRSLREVWDDAAAYVPPDNRRMLASTIQALIDDGAYREEMAARSARRAREMTAARMAEAYLDAYSTVSAASPAVQPV
jgi:glycogen(starch) synthase